MGPQLVLVRVATWMYFAVKVAHTPGDKLNDPRSDDIT